MERPLPCCKHTMVARQKLLVFDTDQLARKYQAAVVLSKQQQLARRSANCPMEWCFEFAVSDDGDILVLCLKR